jgi:hypothetical protein
MNMKFKSLLGAALTSACLLGAAPSQAAYVYDGWQVDTNGAGLASLTVNIGHLNLSGGGAQVTQQLIGGAPIAGSRFTEFGAIYSISYTAENVPGANDFGFPQALNNGLGMELAFTGLEGVVTGFNAITGEIQYMFTGFGAGGSMTLRGTLDGGVTYTNLAAFSALTGGGSLNDFFGGVGTNGDSSILTPFNILTYTPGLIKDSAGNALDPLVAAGRLFMAVRTNNEISSPVSAPFACDIDNDGAVDDVCVNILVTSNGSANLIPEPTVLGLLGAGLLGLGLSRRRKNKAAV